MALHAARRQAYTWKESVLMYALTYVQGETVMVSGCGYNVHTTAQTCQWCVVMITTHHTL